MSEPEDKVEKISGIEGLSSVGKVAQSEDIERVAPNKEHFDALLNNNPQNDGRIAVELPELSHQKAQFIEQIRDVGGQVDLLRRKSPDEILAQTKDVIAQVDDIKVKLRAPELELSPGDQLAMRNRLSHVDEKLRVVLDQVGGEYTPLEVKEAKASLQKPVERFLGMVENAESQLKHVFNQVGDVAGNNGTLDPSAMLMIQVKMGFIQQELEFFTSVLNKSLESTKTLMNVQV